MNAEDLPHTGILIQVMIEQYGCRIEQVWSSRCLNLQYDDHTRIGFGTLVFKSIRFSFYFQWRFLSLPASRSLRLALSARLSADSLHSSEISLLLCTLTFCCGFAVVFATIMRAVLLLLLLSQFLVGLTLRFLVLLWLV